MAVFRIEKSKNYTVMSNHHLRNESLTLKAKGLLSQMLSLPENWDYTLAGLTLINRESVDAIRTAVWELEKAGYITRQQGRDEKGKMAAIVYTIYEQPQEPTPPPPDPEEHPRPVLDYPVLDFPTSDNPTSDFPISENPTQLNKEVIKKEIINTDLSNTHQSIYRASPERTPPSGGMDGIDRMDIEKYRDIIRGNIEADFLCLSHDPERVGEIVELITETVCSPRKSIPISGAEYPADIVKSRFLKLDRSHVEYVFDCMDRNTTKIRNIKAYLLTALYNAPATIGHYYTAEVNHDFGADG